MRYATDREALAAALKHQGDLFEKGRLQQAIDAHGSSAEYGAPKASKESLFRTAMLVRRCSGCNSHWFKFTLANRDAKKHWHEVPEMTLQRTVEEPLALT